MRINKGTYMVVALLLSCFAVKAQSSAVPYTISPIVIANGSTTMIGGTVALIDGGSKCLSVASGLRALDVTANNGGVFGASCAEVAPAGDMLSVTSMNVYPNPTRSLTKLKCDGNFDANLSGQVRIISMDGKVVMSKMVPMQELKSGYVIDASSFASGTYVVSVDFKNKHYTTKLIKIS